jgi:hypothetical protein
MQDNCSELKSDSPQGYIFLLLLGVTLASGQLSVIGIVSIGNHFFTILLLDLGYITLVHGLCLVITNHWVDNYTNLVNIRSAIRTSYPTLELPMFDAWVWFPDINQGFGGMTFFLILIVLRVVSMAQASISPFLSRVIWIGCLLKLLVIGVSYFGCFTSIMVQMAHIYDRIYASKLNASPPMSTRRSISRTSPSFLHQPNLQPPPDAPTELAPLIDAASSSVAPSTTKQDYLTYFTSLRYYNGGVIVALLATGLILIRAIVYGHTITPQPDMIIWSLIQVVSIHGCMVIGLQLMGYNYYELKPVTMSTQRCLPPSKSQISNPESQIPNPESQIPNPKSQIPNFKFRIPNS